MYAVTVRFRLVPGGAADFMPLVLQNARRSLTEEPGCLRFDVCTDPARPDEVFLYELYYSRDMFNRHLETRHFAEFEGAAGELIAEKDIRTFAQVQT